MLHYKVAFDYVNKNIHNIVQQPNPPPPPHSWIAPAMWPAVSTQPTHKPLHSMGGVGQVKEK